MIFRMIFQIITAGIIIVIAAVGTMPTTPMTAINTIVKKLAICMSLFSANLIEIIAQKREGNQNAFLILTLH